MMAAARTSEPLVNFFQTTRHYNPEDNDLRTHRRENLKSYLGMQLFLRFRLLIFEKENTHGKEVSIHNYCESRKKYQLKLI
jgi:hypothetical protein